MTAGYAFMHVTIIGVGYVGLVAGACFADFGHIVTCVDRDSHKISKLNKGEIPILEPGLDELVERNAAAGRLFFSNEIRNATLTADVVILAVGTPARAGDGNADVSL